MTALRDKIIKALTGSSGQKPVMLDTLRKIAEPICDDLQQLYGLLDQLYAAHAVNRASGFKDGKPYVAYWETGAPPPAITFRITQPAPPQRVHQIQPQPAKVQPAASIPPAPKESKMSENEPRKQWLKEVIALVKAQPGITRADVMTKLETDSNRKQLMACISNGIYNKALIATGEGDEAKLTLPKKAKTTPVAPPPKPATRPAKTAATSKPTTKAKAAVPAPITAKHPAFAPEYSFAFGVRKDGGVAICKDGITVVLARAEVQTILAHTSQE